MTQTIRYENLSGLGLTIDELINKANNLVTTATPIYEKVQGAVNTFNQSSSTASNPIPSYQPVIITSPQNPAPQEKSGLSTGAIVGIVAGSLALLTAVVYVATRPTKSVDGLEKNVNKKYKKK